MKRHSRIPIVALVTFALLLAVVGGQATPVHPQPLSHSVEAQTAGGMSCASVGGLAAGLALGALSPCSFVCALGAWYAVGAGWLGGCWN